MRRGPAQNRRPGSGYFFWDEVGPGAGVCRSHSPDGPQPGRSSCLSCAEMGFLSSPPANRLRSPGGQSATLINAPSLPGECLARFGPVPSLRDMAEGDHAAKAAESLPAFSTFAVAVCKTTCTCVTASVFICACGHGLSALQVEIWFPVSRPVGGAGAPEGHGLSSHAPRGEKAVHEVKASLPGQLPAADPRSTQVEGSNRRLSADPALSLLRAVALRKRGGGKETRS